jgi:hypothetical protein
VLGERGRQVRLVLRDHDAKFSRSFHDVFCSGGGEVLVTPVRAPKANADAERWVRTVRAECLDWLLIVGRGHLDQVLRIYVQQYTAHRPHQGLGKVQECLFHGLLMSVRRCRTRWERGRSLRAMGRALLTSARRYRCNTEPGCTPSTSTDGWTCC